MKSKARAFAIKAHKNQKYGDLPYSVHLDEVAKIVKSYGETAEVVAFLHDVVEDTQVTLQEIEDIFGSFVSKCVEILSDEPGETRKIRKSATYQKMSKVSGEETLALLVKAADRLANMRSCMKNKNQRLLDLYLSEYKIFKLSIYRPGLCDEIWLELDNINANN